MFLKTNHSSQTMVLCSLFLQVQNYKNRHVSSPCICDCHEVCVPPENLVAGSHCKASVCRLVFSHFLCCSCDVNSVAL